MGGFQKFFKGLSAFPKKHKKFVTTDSFRFPQGFKIDEGRRQIYLPSICLLYTSPSPRDA